METTKVNQHLIGKSYREIIDNLEVEEDPGDCCGWANCEITDLPADTDLESLVLKDCVKIDYDEEDISRSVLNFIFTDADKGEVILGYDMSAGSGSGYSYGAYIKLILAGEELGGVYY